MKGIIPRALEQIFSFVNDDHTASYDIQVGYLQIYLEMVNSIQLKALTRANSCKI